MIYWKDLPNIVAVKKEFIMHLKIWVYLRDSLDKVNLSNNTELMNESMKAVVTLRIRSVFETAFRIFYHITVLLFSHASHIISYV